MRMTENEAIKELLLCKRTRMFIPQNITLIKAIQALEEIQQYRAIGTVAELQALKEKNEPKKPTDISKVRDNEGYIGLVGKCPSCGEILEEDTVYCDCGQALDWQ